MSKWYWRINLGPTIENKEDGTESPSGKRKHQHATDVSQRFETRAFWTTRLVAISVTATAAPPFWRPARVDPFSLPCLIVMDYDDDTGVIQQNRNYILATCTALGGYEEKETAPGVIKQVYTLGDQALGNRSDRIDTLFGRAPDELTVFFFLHGIQVVSGISNELFVPRATLHTRLSFQHLPTLTPSRMTSYPSSKCTHVIHQK